MSDNDKLGQILFRIIRDNKHMIGPLAYTKKIENDQMESATRLRGESLEYNPEKLLGMDDECVPQMLGEIVHLALFHPDRKRIITGNMKQYDAVADLAADLATYHPLSKSGKFVQPKDLGLDEGKSFEEYFKLLMDKIDKKGIDLTKLGQQQGQSQGQGQGGQGGQGQGQQGQQPGQSGGNQQPKGQDPMQDLLNKLGVKGKDPQDHSQWGSVSQSTQQLAQQAMINALNRNRGELPGELKRLLDSLEKDMQPKWYQKLRNLVGTKIASDKFRRTMKKPSRRMGIPYPGRVRMKRGSIIIAIDTSGSISDHELAVFLHDVKEICDVHQAPFEVIACDAAVHQVARIASKAKIEDFVKELKGGGGTSHVPVFKYIEKERKRPDLLIAFTDLYTEFPSEAPPYKVIWAVIGDQGKEGTKVPFGEVFPVELEEEK